MKDRQRRNIVEGIYFDEHTTYQIRTRGNSVEVRTPIIQNILL
jgi:hypothetical protein